MQPHKFYLSDLKLKLTQLGPVKTSYLLTYLLTYLFTCLLTYIQLLLHARTDFKKDLMAVLWDFDDEVSFSWLVRQIKAGTSDCCRELNAVVKWVFVAVKATVFQYTKPFHPFLCDTWWLDADVHKTWSQHTR